MLLAVALAPHAHSDPTEPPLHVAESGRDAGNCADPAAPCASLGYALQRVGKHGRIEVGPGTFELTEPADVVYLTSGAIDVRGSGDTRLVGVPPAFAAALEARGFRVIVDAKGLDADTRAAQQKLVATQQRVMANHARTDCSGGLADAFPCANVNLLAHVADRTSGGRGADIWGFVDLNTEREYALMSYSTGTAVFDVSDPEDPREVGFVDGQSTTWRDVKVLQSWNATDGRWNAYAYVTADGASDGLVIIDLTHLPHRISRVAYSGDFREAHNVYIADADHATGLSISGDAPRLIIAGSNQQDGRFRVYSLSDPDAPGFVAVPSTPSGQPGGDRLYMHDGASMLVRDARKDSQCVNAAGSDHCDVVFDFNESTLDVWDLTTGSAPRRLSRTPYSNAGYTHSGWPTEDGRFVFLQDELDERDRGLSTTLRIFDLSDLGNPSLAGTWTGPTRAADHNGFVRGNRYYMSNYARGLTVLDITNPAAPIDVGRFDTYPAGDGGGFPGAWGAYPFLPSGHVLISDIDSGLYVLEDDTLDVPQGRLSFAATSYGADEERQPDADRAPQRRHPGRRQRRLGMARCQC